jgi:hypothetical protein
VPIRARWPEVTTDVASARCAQIEFIADEPGDWAMHCHKSHHTMNAMGHDVPTMIGVDHRGWCRRSALVPDYMVMGERGMADMGEMEMPLPDNTLPMMTGHGPFGPWRWAACSPCSRCAPSRRAATTPPPLAGEATVATPAGMIRNEGAMLHEMVIGTRAVLDEHAALMLRFPDMEHDEPYMAHVEPGQSGEIVWHFNRVGEFDFACLIPGHYQAGMVGRIAVDR